MDYIIYYQNVGNILIIGKVFGDMSKKNFMLKRLIGISSAVVFTCGSMFIAGCTEKDDDPIITIENSNDSIVYNFINCTKEDVYLTTTVRCTYKKNSEQEVYFPVSGKLVDKVFVQKGDIVKKGDVLAELSTGNLEQEIAQLEYKIKRNELLVSYVEENEILDAQSIWLNYNLGKIYWNAEARDNALEALYERNDLTIQGYNDTLEFDRLKLQQLKSELAQSRVYATIDGVVYSVAENLEGSTSNVENIVMTLVDNSEGYFETSTKEYVGYFSEGTVVNMNISVGEGKGDYELIPADMENWGDTQKFVLYSGSVGTLDAGTNGNISVVLDYRENVLALPGTCVHEANGEYYVYVLNEDGIREVKWVEVGLIGNTMTEIKSGLEEGEKVIKR